LPERPTSRTVTPMEPETREELSATLEARRELGPGHDEHLIAGFLQRIEKEIDRRVDERVVARAPRTPRRHGGSPLHPANLALCIPIIAIAGGIGHLGGLIVAFAALVLVFVLAEARR
jgi:uncharacterized protein with PIN domain